MLARSLIKIKLDSMVRIQNGQSLGFIVIIVNENHFKGNGTFIFGLLMCGYNHNGYNSNWKGLKWKASLGVRHL